MSKVITAPESLDNITTYPSIFLAGGITNCSNWQQNVIKRFDEPDLDNVTLINPRRENFPIEDPNAATEQIHWEVKALKKADAILYWFCSETLCPIVLFELGAYATSGLKKVFIGSHPDYARLQDIQIQMGIARPNVTIHDNLESLCVEVEAFAKYFA